MRVHNNINDELNHANSYYWLARGNYNHPYYLRLSLEHIENARKIAESNNEFTDSLSFSKIIDEIATTRTTERGGRADDKRAETAMEDRKKQGYF